MPWYMFLWAKFRLKYFPPLCAFCENEKATSMTEIGNRKTGQFAIYFIGRECMANYAESELIDKFLSGEEDIPWE